MITLYSNKMVYGVVLLGLFLSGCDDRISLADAEMEKIKNERAQEIAPPPTPKKVEDYTYAAQNIRSPFIPQSLLERQQKIAQMPSVKPDENRPKEPLEEYELSQLVYRGKVVAPNGQEYGLVQTPSGLVENIQVGNYMGKNYGRVTEITATQINLIEIVKDTEDQYVEKAASISSPN